MRLEKLYQSSYMSFVLSSLLVVGYMGGVLALEYYLSDEDMPPDSYSYLDFARSVTQSGWAAASEKDPVTSSFPPLLVLSMVSLNRLGMEMETAGRIMNIVPCLLASIGILCCTWQLYNNRFLAFCTALAVSSLPGWNSYGTGILRDPLYWMLAVWSCAVLMYCSNNMKRKVCIPRCLFLGLLAGLALLCRKEAVILIAGEMMVAIFLIFSQKQPVRQKVFFFIGASLVFLLPILITFFLLKFSGVDIWNLMYQAISSKRD